MELTTYVALRDAIEREIPAAAAKVIEGPHLGGNLVLVYPDRAIGSLGDPALDAHAADELHELLKSGGATQVQVGESRLFLEAHLPVPHLVIIGAVHIAIALVGYAKILGFRTTVIDARGQFITGERFPHVDRLIEAWPDEALAEVPLHPGVAAVCLAHDPKFEDPAMHVLLRSQVGYIGAIGSRNTSQERRERLRAAGFTDADLDRIHGPVGIDIGAKTPEEIALSIMAEVIAVRNGRDPRAAAAPAKSTSTVS